MSGDMKFASSLTEAWMERDSKSALLLFWTLVTLFIAFFIWASNMELEVVTRGSGSVVPSDSLYVVDNLEGGILAKLKVGEGDVVRNGEMLLKIDNSTYLAALQENKKMQFTLHMTLLRLRAELASQDFIVDQDEEYGSSAIKDERRFFIARKQQHQEKRMAFEQQIADTKREVHENSAVLHRLQAEVSKKKLDFPSELGRLAPETVALESRFFASRKKFRDNESRRLRRLLNNLKKEYEANVRLEKAGAASEMEVLKLRRTILETQGRRAKLNEEFQHTASMELKERREKKIALVKTLSGFESALIDHDKQRLSEITESIRGAESELALLREKRRALQDNVDRSTVYSPIDGVVNKIYIKNRGAVIKPGQEIIEIVPSTETLLIEAAIAPQDIAFIRPKQKAVVKVSAYDFAIYGGLDGEVASISPDTHENEEGMPFYKVRVKTNGNQIGDDRENLIIPGMSVEVDLISGKRSLLDYILKPLRRMSTEALRER
jgi:membrane fusion protein, adhesin transport system